MCTVASCGVSMMWCLCFYCGVSHVSSIHLSPSPKMDIVLAFTMAGIVFVPPYWGKPAGGNKTGGPVGTQCGV